MAVLFGREAVVMDNGTGWTVRTVEPLMPASTAEIVAVPADTQVARPAVFTVATLVIDDVQITWLVIFRLVPSEYVPVAVNCWELPNSMIEFAGLTAIEVSVGEGWTVRAVLPVTPASVVEIVVLPANTAVAKPPALTVATAKLDEFQVA